MEKGGWAYISHPRLSRSSQAPCQARGDDDEKWHKRRRFPDGSFLSGLRQNGRLHRPARHGRKLASSAGHCSRKAVRAATLSRLLSWLAAAITLLYFDYRNWRFTPAWFQLIILELAWLGLADWRADRVGETHHCEFPVQLSRGGTAWARSFAPHQLQEMRLGLLRATLLEQRAQIGKVGRLAQIFLGDLEFHHQRRLRHGAE